MPSVRGSRVEFAWKPSEPSTFTHADCFWVDYHGVDVSSISVEMWMSVLLGHMLPVWSLHPGPVRVRLPRRLPVGIADYWAWHHDVDNVEFSPTTELPQPASAACVALDGPSVAVMFGGGKDSTLALSVLRELLGEDRLLIVNLIETRSRSEARRRQIAARRYPLLTRVGRNSGVPVLTVSSSHLSNLTSAGMEGRPHLDRYVTALCPILALWGIRTVTFSHEITGYFTHYADTGEPYPRFRRSRPEVCREFSCFLERDLGVECRVLNPNYPLSELLAFRILRERYPAAFSAMEMCMATTRPARRWCGSCKKCNEYALMGLHNGFIDPDFDYDGLYARSQFIHKAIERMERQARKYDRDTELPWQDTLGSPIHASSCHHLLASVDAGLLDHRVSRIGLSNLRRLQQAYGSSLFPELEVIPQRAVSQCSSDLVSDMSAVYRQHTPVVDTLHGIFRHGSRPMRLDFDFSVEPFGHR